MSNETGAARPHSLHVQAPNRVPIPSARRPSSAALWTSFWRDFCLEDQPHERCPVPPDGRRAVDRHWADFAGRLPHGTRVIDLGCGAGIVGRTLLRQCDDLLVTGVDFANVPALEMANLTIEAEVDMEALPHKQGASDAAVSLFGIEYASIARAAPELARVLRPAAPFSLLLHHKESAIVREGDGRRRALRALLSERTGAAFVNGSDTVFERQSRRLEEEFPGDPSRRLFDSYLRRKRSGARAERSATWKEMHDNLGPEVALLTRLVQSAKSAPDLAAWLGPVVAAMEIVSVSILRGQSGRPIAWRVTGER